MLIDRFVCLPDVHPNISTSFQAAHHSQQNVRTDVPRAPSALGSSTPILKGAESVILERGKQPVNNLLVEHNSLLTSV